MITRKPVEITLETLPQLFAHWSEKAGGMTMTIGTPENTPERPDDIAEEEWTALGEPGQRAVVRERDARKAAERALAASRQRPAPPKKTTQPAPVQQTQQPQEPAPADADAIATAVATAVGAALKPVSDFMAAQQEKDAQAEAEQAAGKIVDAVMKAAKGQFVTDETSGAAMEFHNPANALSMIDLTKVTDGNGAPDEAKILAELKGLLGREKHLGKVVDTRRTAAPSSMAGPSGHKAPLEDRVQRSLAHMQQSNGIKPTNSGT